jgi:NAD(P)-dependent dehydrogenase (short-subunit alcohol dehydrogenase family)
MAGAGPGIGRALALRLAQASYALSLCSHRQGGQETAHALRGKGHEPARSLGSAVSNHSFISLARCGIR